MKLHNTLLLMCALGCCASALATFGPTAVVPAAWSQTFPPYYCDRNVSNSPFRMNPVVSTTPIPNGNRVCFTVDPVAPCDRTNKCCRTNFFKLELDVRPVCNRAIRAASLNGKPLSMPVFNFYGASNSKGIYKVTNLGLTTRNATGAVICVDLIGNCPNLAALCGTENCAYATVEGGPGKPCTCCPAGRFGANPPPPSPPPPPPSLPPPALPIEPSVIDASPPPPPSAFPFCVCDRTFGSLPFTFPMGEDANGVEMPLAPVASKRGGINNVYCWQLETLATCSGSKCASSLSKIEWHVPNTCRGSVQSVTVDGVARSGTWADRTFRITAPAGKSVLFTAAQVAQKPRNVCVELRTTSACNSLATWCAGSSCTVSFFDQGRTTCPTLMYPEA